MASDVPTPDKPQSAKAAAVQNAVQTGVQQGVENTVPKAVQEGMQQTTQELASLGLKGIAATLANLSAVVVLAVLLIHQNMFMMPSEREQHRIELREARDEFIKRNDRLGELISQNTNAAGRNTEGISELRSMLRELIQKKNNPEAFWWDGKVRPIATKEKEWP